MRPNQNPAIKKNMYWGFGLIVFLYILVGIFSFIEIKSLGFLVNTIYEHPLKVSNGSLHAMVGVTKIHRNMKDVVLTDNSISLEETITEVAALEASVFQELDMIRETILGSEGKAHEIHTREMFLQWRPIREEVIALVKRGEVKKAAQITMGKGANHEILLEQQMLKLTSYAQNKAEGFRQQSIEVERRFALFTIIAVATGTLLSFIIAFFTVRQTMSVFKQKKVAVEAQRESERTYRSIVESIPGITYRCKLDHDWTALIMSRNAKKITGYPASDFINNAVRSFESIIHREDTEYVNQFVNEAVEAGKPWEIQYRICHKDGNIRWMHENGRGVIGKAGTVQFLEGVILDITDRMQEVDRYKRTIEISIDGFWILDSNGKVLEVNDASCRMTGYSRAELLMLSIVDLEAFLSPEEIGIKIQDIIKYGSGRFETKHHQKNGSIIDVDVSATFSSESGGRFFVFIRDITEQKANQIKLSTTLNHLQSVLNNAPIMLSVVNPEGKFILSDGSELERQGRKPGELVGQSVYDLYKDRPDLIEYGERALKGESVTAIFERGGQFLEGFFDPIRDENGEITGIVVLSLNITKRKLAEEEKEQLQQQLQQATKMQAVGTLAGGIAHEFNNLLAVIMGCTELALADLARDSFAKVQLDNVLKASFRVRDLVKQILTFSRQSHQQKKSMNLCILVRDSLQLIRSSIPSSVVIDECIDTTCGNGLVDQTEIQQIIMSRCSNAVWAMKEKGTIIIDLHPVHLRHDEAALLGLSEGDYLKLSFSDNGHVMDSTTKSRIFDPFYSRKEVGQGTGMGLSIVHSIMGTYHGAITVDSEVGEGTTFYLYFPATHAPETLEVLEEGEYPGGTECILFVDDEEMYAEMAVETISRLGYKVELQTRSTEALEVFKSDPDKYKLVITDQVMPGLSGEELVQEIKSIRPELPVILCTGYSSQIDEGKAKDLGINEFAYKPIITKDIAQLIRKVLD